MFCLKNGGPQGRHRLGGGSAERCLRSMEFLKRRVGNSFDDQKQDKVHFKTRKRRNYLIIESAPALRTSEKANEVVLNCSSSRA